jgi:hypothetical protein
MTMTDHGALLHNSGVPPRTVVTYSGLSELAKTHGPGVAGIGYTAEALFGTPVRFELPAELAGRSAADILHRVGMSPEDEPDRALAALIDARANELPLPDGCVVIPTDPTHRLIWGDVLSTLAILAKCSDSIWLRAKNPALKAALVRQKATLLVPPLFAKRLPEVSP